MQRQVVSRSVEATRALGSEQAQRARPGSVYALVGQLGAGKTEFVRGFVAQLAPAAAVRSPSFTLLNVYEEGAFPIYHFDFYRLNDATELGEVGLAEYLAGDGVCLVEWADRFEGELPDPLTRIAFEVLGDGSRRIVVDEA